MKMQYNKQKYVHRNVILKSQFAKRQLKGKIAF